MLGTHAIGTRVRLRATFTTDAGLVDPQVLWLTMVCQVSRSGGPREIWRRVYVYDVDMELERLSQGLFQLELLLTVPGKYMIRWESRGTGEESVVEESLVCAPLRF